MSALFYLDGTQIDEPKGFSGEFYWTRVRNPEYFGIWRHATATVKGVGEVGFDGVGRRILKTVYDRDKTNGKCLFYIEEAGQRVYQGEVDFNLWRDDGRFFYVNFRDEDGVELDALADLVVGLTPQTLIELPQQPLSEGIAYEIDPGQRGAIKGGSTYSIPFKAAQQGEGSGLSVVLPTNQEPIYLNRTDRTARIEISGKLVGSFSGSGTVSITAQTTVDGVVKSEIQLALIATSGSEQQIILSQTIQVPPGAYVRILADPTDTITATHSGDTFLTLYENAETTESFVWGLTFKQAVTALLQTITGGKVSLSSSYLTKGVGATRLLTSEPNLRGYKRDVQTSFRMLWEDMNRIDNLACWRRGGTLYIETKAQMIRMVGRTRVDDYETLSHGPADLFVSRIQSGYDLWSSGTAAGREEFCSLRTHQTKSAKVKESVDLVCRNISASGRLMEVLRRNPQGQSADSGMEERLFVIVAGKSGSGYAARTGGVTGVTNPATVINADISPRQNLLRWMNYYGVNGTATLVSGQANTTAEVGGISESKPVEPTTQLFTGRRVMMQLSMTMQEYKQLGEVIEYTDHDGQDRAFLVTEDSYRFSNGKATLMGYELNE